MTYKSRRDGAGWGAKLALGLLLSGLSACAQPVIIGGALEPKVYDSRLITEGFAQYWTDDGRVIALGHPADRPQRAGIYFWPPDGRPQLSEAGSYRFACANGRLVALPADGGSAWPLSEARCDPFRSEVEDDGRATVELGDGRVLDFGLADWGRLRDTSTLPEAYSPLFAILGVIVPKKERPHRHEDSEQPLVLWRDGTAKSLPIKLGEVKSGAICISRAPFKKAILLESRCGAAGVAISREKCRAAWWIHDDDRIEALCLPEEGPWAASVYQMVPTRAGFVYAQRRYAATYEHKREHWVWLWDGTSFRSLLAGNMSLAVSPDGCMVAGLHSPNLKPGSDSGGASLKAIDVCSIQR